MDEWAELSSSRSKTFRQIGHDVFGEDAGANPADEQLLEAIASELTDLQRSLDRLYRAIETTDLDITDIAPRIRQHGERELKLQDSAREAEAMLAERRVTLDDVETIKAFAQDLSAFLMESELTERKAFIRRFVKEIAVRPGKATILYTIPMPFDGRVAGRVSENVPLPGSVLSTVRPGTPGGTRTHAPSSGG